MTRGMRWIAAVCAGISSWMSCPDTALAACPVGEVRCSDGSVEKCVQTEDGVFWEVQEKCSLMGDECVEEEGTAACVTPSCSGFTIDYDNLRRNSSYPYGETFFSGGFFHDVTEFVDASSTVHFDGQAVVTDSGYALGADQQLAIGVAGIAPAIPPAPTIELEYAETGNDVSLTINDEERIEADMIDFDGAVLGGVAIAVIPASSTQGRLILTRDTRSVLSLRFAGHELYVDSVEGCATLPEISCTPGETRCTESVLESCGYASTGEAGWLAEDCAASGGRCFEAADGARCLPPVLPSASAVFADPENYYFVKHHLTWQTTWAVYDRSSPSLKTAYEDWSNSPGTIPNKPDLHAAIDAAMAWLEDPERSSDLHGQAASVLDLGGSSLGPATTGTSHPNFYLAEAEAWHLYVTWMAQAIALDMSGELPWTLDDVAGWGWADQPALFDGAEMMFRSLYDDYGLGFQSHPNFDGTEWGNYLGQTIIGMPRETMRFLQSEDLIRRTPEATAEAVLEWTRHRLVHFYGHATRDNAMAHWGVPHYPTVEHVIGGTVRTGELEPRHWTLGCHGTSAFLRHILRAANIPARVLQTCGHAQLWVGTGQLLGGDMFLDHGDNPYNLVFRSSSCGTDHLLLEDGAYFSRFLHDYNHDDAATCGWIGYQATPASTSTCP